jgi:tyrosine-protein phosphatase SIW14
MTRRKILAALAVLAAGLIIFVVSPPHENTSAEDLADLAHAPAPRVALDGVRNSGEVTPTLFRGAQPTREGFMSLAKNGIEIVVDLRFEGDREAERQAVTHAGMQYVGIPWSCHYPSDSITARFLDIIRENPDKKIFVHCEHGVDRTGLMIAAYRIADQGWTPEQARREMIAYGFDFVHRTWCRAVISYEDSFPQRFSSSPAFVSLRHATQK